MSLEMIPEDNPFVIKDCFRTLDWRFTDQAHYDFKEVCHAKLREAQEKGKGYFIEAGEYYLHQRLLSSLQDEDYVSVANYAMMMYTKKRVNKEKEECLAQQPRTKVYADDDFL